MIIGIDPAYSKPTAFSTWEGKELISWGTTISIEDLAERIFNCTKVFLEDQFLLRNPQVLKNLAHSAGKIMGLCEYIGRECILVAPSTWQNKLNIPKKPRKTKKNPDIIVPSDYQWGTTHIQDLLDKAMEISRCLIDSEDIAAAILIGYAMGVMEEKS